MTKYALIIASIINLSYAMESNITQQIVLEDSILKKNKETFCHLLDENKIEVNGCNVLHIGCGLGDISAELAKKANMVTGLSSNNHVLNRAAAKHSSIKNLEFANCSTIKENQSYDKIIYALVFHTIKNQQETLNYVYKFLKEKGEFFAPILTDNPTPLNIQVAQKLLNQDTFKNLLQTKNFNDNFNTMSGLTFPSTDELKEMLANANFEIILFEKQEYLTIYTKEEIMVIAESIIKNSPLMKDINNENFNEFFEAYKNLYLSKLKFENGQYTEIFYPTIVHARKKQVM